jgi:two-component system sensor histidine kinase BarA
MFLPCQEPGESYWPVLVLDAQERAICIVDVDGNATQETLTRLFAASGFMVRTDWPDTGRDEIRVVCADSSRVGSLDFSYMRNKPFLVAISQFHSDKQIDRDLAAKVDAIIYKPILRSEIEALVVRINRGETDPRPAKAIKVPAIWTTAFMPFNVLVADDNIVNREVATEALAGLGGIVKLAHNGIEAVDALKSKRFDIVFMDGSMPEMDGMTAARHIRRFEAETGTRRTPIVGLTAHVVGMDAKGWHEAGMDTVVYKPFTIAELVRTIETLLPGLSRIDAKRSNEFDGAVQQFSASPIPPSVQAKSNAAQLQLLDSEVMDQLVEMQLAGHENFAQRVIGLYDQNAPLAIDQIERMIADCDIDGCARAAHSLKSMSYNIGARQVAQMAFDIEALCREDESLPSTGSLAAMREALNKTMREIGSRVTFDDCGLVAKALKNYD